VSKLGVQIRPALIADMPGVLEITNQAILNTTAIWTLTPATLQSREQWLADRQGKGFPVLVAEHQGEVVGFASFSEFRPHEGYLHTVEHSLYVAPGVQGRGVGGLLLQAVIDKAVDLNKHVMVAGIEARNVASIKLHEAYGFERVGYLPEVGRKFDRWLDLLFMQRVLPEK
jgi:phosphinothricin acetyltransferase